MTIYSLQYICTSWAEKTRNFVDEHKLKDIAVVNVNSIAHKE